MKQLISHIEYLLTEHDCVIVPGFGGFVVQQIEASFSDIEVLPPSREICFNAELTHDDGLLYTNVSKVNGIDYAEARRLVTNELEILKSNISRQQTIELGSIGSFRLDDDRNLIFASASNASNLIDYGFQPMRMSLLANLTNQKVEAEAVAPKDKDIIQIRFSKRKMLRGVASVAAVWMLWMFAAPVSDVKVNTSCAGLIDRAELIKVIQKNEAVAVVDSTIQKDSTATQAVINPSTPKLEVEAKAAENIEKYFVVLGSFQTEKSAEKHREQLTSEGIQQVKVKKMGTLMRTYLCGFADKAKAEHYLQTIRYDKDQFNEAWLYCAKN
jgi:nucleoid DNA-binding protein